MLTLSARTRTLESQLADSIRHEMDGGVSTADSIRMLSDIYDLSTLDKEHLPILQVYEIAKRTGDHDEMLGAACRYANTAGADDSTMALIMRDLHKLPKSLRRESDIIFIDLCRHQKRIDTMTADERYDELVRLIAENEIVIDDLDAPSDTLSAIHNMFKVVLYMTGEYESSYVSEYLDRLGEMINAIGSFSLRNYYLRLAAMAYTSTQNFSKAIELDRQLLDAIELMRQDALRTNHPFRNFDLGIFESYRRMMLNYPGLTKDEIEFCNKEIIRLAKQWPYVSERLSEDERPKAYYLIATGRYDEAIPILQKILRKNDLPIASRIRSLDLLSQAAKATGNNELLLITLKQQAALLEKFNDENSNQQYRELQIKYDIHTLKTQKSQLESSEQHSELRFRRFMIIILIVTAIVLAVMIVILYLYFQKSRYSSKRLAAAIDKLKDEDDRLTAAMDSLVEERNKAQRSSVIKDDFLHSVSHELRTPLNAVFGLSQQIERKINKGDTSKLATYSQHIHDNVGQLEKTINDVMFVSDIPGMGIEANMRPVTIGRILEECTLRFSGKVHENIELRIVNTTPEDFAVFTDLALVERILANLVSNAIKFTSTGWIEVKAALDRDREYEVVFTVADTGSGIAADHAKDIFEPFYKLDPFKPGIGLGLFISRSIAKIIGGVVVLVKSDSSGSTFALKLNKIHNPQ